MSPKERLRTAANDLYREAANIWTIGVRGSVAPDLTRACLEQALQMAEQRIAEIRRIIR